MRAFGLFLAAIGSGCFTTVPDVQPAGVEGHYDMFVQNSSNGCGFTGFDRTMDQSNASLEFSLWADGSPTTLKGQFQGPAVLLLVLWFGSRDLSAKVNGNKIEIRPQTLNRQMLKNCSFILDVRAEATVRSNGHIDDGVIHYRGQNLSADPDCKPLETCETTQTFTATMRGPAILPDGGA